MNKRRGVVAPLAAFLVVALLAMMAFSIDIGYVVAVKSELQNAADAAALAGAEQLQQQFVLYYAPGQTQQQQIYTYVTTNTTDASAPIPTAQRFAGYNQAGNVNLSLPASDVTFSYYDGTTFSDPSYPNQFPNTVNVTTRRDGNANGSLGLFFAQFFGINTLDLTATASATIYAGDVSSLQAISGVDAHILPVALDLNIWTNFVQANWTSPWLQGLTSNGPSNAMQLQVYPSNTNTPGSFGLVDLGPPATNSPAFRQWINNGETPNDINYLVNNNLVPVSVQSPKSWTVGTGMTSTLQTNFQLVEGVPNLLPLFVPVNPSTYPAASPGNNYVAASSQGSNACYAIVGFVSVTVTQATDKGNANMNISIQPMAGVDPTAVISNPKPAQGTVLTQFGTPQTTFVSAKLTR
jgi:Flp pilus assembly protein TadG